MSGGMIAIHGDAAAHHIVLILGQFESTAAVCCMQNGTVAIASGNGHKVVKSCRLLPCKALVREFRYGKVRKHAFKDQVWTFGKILQCRLKGLCAHKADAVHAGIHLEMESALFSCGGRCGLQLPERVYGENGRRQIMLENAADVRVHRSAEYQNRCFNAGCAQTDALFRDGNAEIVGAVIAGIARNFFQTMPIGVRFDNSQKFCLGFQPGANHRNIVRDIR